MHQKQTSHLRRPLQGNHIHTSGATGTNAAVIKGALRAEKPELLTVVLPQSRSKQPPESQEMLQQVGCPPPPPPPRLPSQYPPSACKPPNDLIQEGHGSCCNGSKVFPFELLHGQPLRLITDESLTYCMLDQPSAAGVAYQAAWVFVRNLLKALEKWLGKRLASCRCSLQPQVAAKACPKWHED